MNCRDRRSELILSLDDYHLIEDATIHAALTFFIEYLPPQVHLAIATRTDPPLPLAKLRVRSQLTELRPADLRFTDEEATAFLAQSLNAHKIAGRDAAKSNRRLDCRLTASHALPEKCARSASAD